MIYKGFLYGCYNSRGGASFVNAPDKATADKWYHNATLPGEEFSQEEADFDFITPMEIETDLDISKYEDLEEGYVPEGSPVLWVPFDMEEGIVDDLPNPVKAKFQVERPEGWFATNFGEDACGVVVIMGDTK